MGQLKMLPMSQLVRILFPSFLLAVSLCAGGVHAQPSGGPYGPIDQRYEIPKAAHVYYVAPDGAADATGDKLQEPTTLEAAISRVVSGDAIILRGGVYRTGNLVLNQGITMQPYQNEKPILKGTRVASDWQASGDNVWRTSWSTLFPSEPMFWWRRDREEARTPLHRFNNDMVFIDGEFLQSAGGVDELDEHTYYIDYKNQHVYIGSDPSGRTVEITAHDTAILRTSSEVHGKTSDKKGPKIRGITFTQYAWTAFSIEGKRHFTHTDEPVDEPIGVADPSTYGKEAVGTLLENVTISFCSRVAGYFRGDGLVIRNSLVSDTSTEGLYVIGSSDVLLERNIIQRNNIENITGYFASAVKIINQTHDVVVRDNLVIDHPNSVGVWYDIGNRNGVVVNNHIEGTATGFFFEISEGVTVAGNVLADNDVGMRILNAADAHIYNNTLVDSPVWIQRTERSAQGDHFGWHPATGPDVDERDGHVLINNLLVSNQANTGPLLRVDQSPKVCTKLDDSPLTAMDGNVYVRPVAPYANLQSPLINWIDTQAEDCSVSFEALTAVRKHLSPFAGSSMQLEGTARSLFMAPDISRYQLIKALTVDKKVAMPKGVRKLIGWSRKEAARTVGAYPAK